MKAEPLGVVLVCQEACGSEAGGPHRARGEAGRVPGAVSAPLRLPPPRRLSSQPRLPECHAPAQAPLFTLEPVTPS